MDVVAQYCVCVHMLTHLHTQVIVWCLYVHHTEVIRSTKVLIPQWWQEPHAHAQLDATQCMQVTIHVAINAAKIRYACS